MITDMAEDVRVLLARIDRGRGDWDGGDPLGYALDVIAAARWDSREVTEQEFRMLPIGREDGPALLWAAWGAGSDDPVITEDTLRALLPGVWSATETPSFDLEPDEWRGLFYDIGFTIGGEPRRRFRKARRLYRGATAEGRAGWSWTGSVDVAQQFANGISQRPKGQVWTVLAPPASILAVIGDQGRGDEGTNEDEYVVDTDGLEITLWDGQQ